MGEDLAVLSVRPVDLKFAVPTFTKGVKVRRPAEAQVSVRGTGVTSLNILRIGREPGAPGKEKL